jgi:23S rRNA (cytidine2498-2'-O)-methyltransferase
MKPRYYYLVSQHGAEKAAKNDVLKKFPHLKFAFSRPGFVTFKEEDDQKPEIKNGGGVFGRLWGTSIGTARDPEAFTTLMDSLPEGCLIHTFERNQFVPGDEPKDYVERQRIDEVLDSIPDDVKERFVWDQEPHLDQPVVDLIWIDEGNVFFGQHIHSALLLPNPGNLPKIPVLSTAPSRAYQKIEEAILRFKPEFKKDLVVLEVGCSPGGATLAMLNKGFLIAGVDPKSMADAVIRHPNFRFIQQEAQTLRSMDLMDINPQWLVLDMNLAPLETLDELAHVIQVLRHAHHAQLALKHGFLTIKLNDWKFAESIPLYLRRIEEMGFKNLRPMQLATNRQEFFVMADF